MIRCVASLCAALVAAVVVAEPTRVACIGDSITYGYGLADRAKESYPAQLQLLLEAKSAGKYEVRNFGNSGRGVYLDSMRGKEKRGYRWMKEHAEAVAWKPDVVICNLGINDNGEYIKEYAGGRKRGQFENEYLQLLADYKKANARVQFFIWTKLSPLIAGQKFYRSPEPFLMQSDLEKVAKRAKATGIDMQEPFRNNMDAIFAKDKIHPNAAGAKIIAEATFSVLTRRDASSTGSGSAPAAQCTVPAAPPPRGAVTLPLTKMQQEVWLCAGQSNMQQGWGFYERTPEEKARVVQELAQLDKVDIRFWDFNDGSWTKLTSKSPLAREKCANGISFAIRRAQKTKRQICLLYVAAGGAPTEAFLSEQVMCAVGPDGKPKYPNLCRIATNRHPIDANGDFPCAWCKREFPRRKGKAVEAAWWPVSLMYDKGVKLVKDLPLTGVYWYQGESNATRNIAPDQPLADDYMLETNLAIIDQLRGEKKIPFVMMGLPKMNRPWAPYRAAQKKACEEKGAIYVDSFAAGLGDERDVHPRNKIPFAELVMESL